MEPILNELKKISAALADIKANQIQIKKELVETKNELTEVKTELCKVKAQLVGIETELADANSLRYFGDWIPRKTLMRFLEYGDTKIAAIFKKGGLVVAEVGNRKFIKKDSVLKFLEKCTKDS